MKEVFRLRRMHFRVGLLTLPLFMTMQIVSVLGMIFNAPSDKVFPFDVAGIFVYSFMVGISLWLILASYRESITLDDGEIRFVHVLSKRTIAVSDVLRARWWSSRPSLKLFWRGGTQVVWFGNYRADQCDRLIRYFRERLAPEVQEGWDDALERYATEVVAKEEAEAFDKVFRGLWKFVVVGPPCGIACGLVIHLYAARLGVTDIPTWTGSVVLDWGAIGMLVGVGIVVMVWAGKWLDQPER